jgi:hypothetical protein
MFQYWHKSLRILLSGADINCASEYLHDIKNVNRLNIKNYLKKWLHCNSHNAAECNGEHEIFGENFTLVSGHEFDDQKAAVLWQAAADVADQISATGRFQNSVQ